MYSWENTFDHINVQICKLLFSFTKVLQLAVVLDALKTLKTKLRQRYNVKSMPKLQNEELIHKLVLYISDL